MVKIIDLFAIERGASHSESDYSVGDIPFVSSTERKNGVASYVAPFPDDKVFQGGVVTISCFGHAFYQPSAFLPKANGGSAVAVLTPLVMRSSSWLLAFCAAFNQGHKWRFGFGRMASGQSRLDSLELDEALIERIASQVKVEAPKPVTLEVGVLHQVIAKLRDLYGDNPTIGDVFELRQGEEISPSTLLEEGLVPVVSASVKETNAVIGYLAEASTLLPCRALTVSKHVGGARLQLSECAITANAIGLVPHLGDWSDSELVVLAALIDRQAWRISYGRIYSEKRLGPLRLLDGLSIKPAYPRAA